MTKAERIAHQRATIVREYLQSGLTLQAYLSINRYTPSLATLSRWIRAYNSYGINGLKSRYHSGGGYGATLSERQKALLQLYWLHANRPSLRHCLRQIETQKNEKIPYDTARRYLKSLPEGLKIRRRLGASAYTAQVEPYLRRDYTQLAPMDMVCADHHTLDVMCVDSGDPERRIYRPILTAWIDMRSRKILSWTLRRGSPNQWRIMETLEQLVNNHGVPQAILIDNGKDFVAGNLTGKKINIKEWDKDYLEEVSGVFGQLNCQVIRATPYRGQAKPIERLFGFIASDFCKQYPSYTGSDTSSRSDEARRYHSNVGKLKKKPLMLTLEQLQRAFADWVAWYNDEWKHSGQGMDGKTPDTVFATRKSFSHAPDWLSDRIFCRIEQRIVRRDGVQLEGEMYYDADIVARYLRNPVIVRRPFKDTSKIHVYTQKDEYIGEMVAIAEYGLISNNDTEANIAASKRAAKKVKKELQKYEHAIAEERRTAASQHQPSPEFLRAVNGKNDQEPPQQENDYRIPLLFKTPEEK